MTHLLYGYEEHWSGVGEVNLFLNYYVKLEFSTPKINHFSNGNIR